MTTQELNNYIKHYLNNDRTHTAIMLTGAWGSGKSYYIENELVPFLNKGDKNVCVVISLYGLEELADVSKSIYMEMRMPTFSKKSEGFTTGKVIAKSVIKSIISTAGVDINITNKDLKKLYASIDLKGKLLILEDLERCNIEIVKILGFVNGLVERDGAKVLLVANEGEIQRNEKQIESEISTIINGKKQVCDGQETIPEVVGRYIRIKEKTISDTIYFSTPFNEAIRNIIKGFNNQKLNDILNDDILNELTSIVQKTCRRNLRTFIFAVQKTIDILEKIPSDTQYEVDFYQCIFWGIIYLSSKIKNGVFPKWEGTDYLSSNLGSNEMPLMRFAYDYVRWQVIDFIKLKETYDAYKRLRFYEKDAEYKDEDLMILEKFADETEENVLNALKNVEKKLNSPEKIGIYAYSKLAYYMTYVANVVGFNSDNARELMIRNVRGKGIDEEINSEIFFLRTYYIEGPNIKKKYENFISELVNSIDSSKAELSFSYRPNELDDFYVNVWRNKSEYMTGHQFISKYSVYDLVEMLKESTSKQIGVFRNVLFVFYRNAGREDFIDEDIKTLRELLHTVEKVKEEDDNTWDKIQLMQISYLISNIEEFIHQMT